MTLVEEYVKAGRHMVRKTAAEAGCLRRKPAVALNGATVITVPSDRQDREDVEDGVW